MCGIAGILKLNPHERPDPARVRRMRDALSHRGPDGHGLLSAGPVCLGHRRLAIVDVALGHQPMANEDGSVWIVFNGEIYNHAELRPLLVSRGHVYKTRSDTETILHLYEEEGDRCVERLRGMFAFALWDHRRRRLLLARDRLGIKPLYYAVRDGELVFASEVKGLLESGAVKPAFNESVLPEFLATRFVSGEDTFFRGIRKLLPGRTLSWSPGQGLCERRYWQVPSAVEQNGHANLEERASELRWRLREVVRSHLMSDVPLGIFLSGGVDSSGLLALMAPLVKQPVHAFAVGFDEPGANELPYARLAAASVGARYDEVVVSPREFWDALPKLIWHEDEPIAFPSSVPLYFVSRLAHEHVKVVLTGEGADELFLGYNRYRVTAWNERLGRPYWRLVPQHFQRRANRLVDKLPGALRRYAQRSFVALGPGARALFYENFAVFPEPLQRRFLSDPGLFARDPYAFELRCYEEGNGGALERMSRADLQTYLVRLLMKQDQMSMAASIESRVPFLDHDLVERVVALPGHFKLRGFTTKAVLREALRPLVPREILTRPKMGFPVPVGSWLRGPFYPLVEELVLGPRALARQLFAPAELKAMAQEHRAGAAEHGDRLWLLINLEIWHRVFVEGDRAWQKTQAA
jgi:asparagine synthase (glutamine-hydrolysing)